MRLTWDSKETQTRVKRDSDKTHKTTTRLKILWQDSDKTFKRLEKTGNEEKPYHDWKWLKFSEMKSPQKSPKQQSYLNSQFRGDGTKKSCHSERSLCIKNLMRWVETDLTQHLKVFRLKSNGTFQSDHSVQTEEERGYKCQSLSCNEIFRYALLDQWNTFVTFQGFKANVEQRRRQHQRQ